MGPVTPLVTVTEHNGHCSTPEPGLEVQQFILTMPSCAVWLAIGQKLGLCSQPLYLWGCHREEWSATVPSFVLGLMQDVET